MKAGTVRIVLSLAQTHKCCLRQVDINNAFLHCELSDEVYIVQPPRFEQPATPFGYVIDVCKLKKALYGFKQVPHAWFEKLKSFLIKYLSFKVSVTDKCMFIKTFNNKFVLLLVYVDDIVIAGSSTNQVEDIVAINNKFKLNDLVSLNYFLSIEIVNREKFILLNQKKYIKDLN